MASETKIIMTGATGFLGSHVAMKLLSQGYSIAAIKRKNSNLWRCKTMAGYIQWVDIEDDSLHLFLNRFRPDILIHLAWNGVTAVERNQWENQLQNISLTYDLLKRCAAAGISKFIGIGSQAEYGFFHGRINESQKCVPQSAYGAAKLATSTVVETYCNQQNIQWYWLRQFSVFGPKEDPVWVLSSTIKSLLLQQTLDLTACEQKYDYLYVDDFAKAIYNVTKIEADSGRYNLSSNSACALRDLLETIRTLITDRHDLLNFGALPYRSDQVMHMEGDSSLFYKTFDFKPSKELKRNLEKTIAYYKTIIH